MKMDRDFDWWKNHCILSMDLDGYPASMDYARLVKEAYE